MQSLKPFLNHSNNFNKCFLKCRQALKTSGLMCFFFFLLLHVPSLQHCSAPTDYNNVIFALAFCGLPSDSINGHVKLLRSAHIGNPGTIVLSQRWGNTYSVPIGPVEHKDALFHCLSGLQSQGYSTDTRSPSLSNKQRGLPSVKVQSYWSITANSLYRMPLSAFTPTAGMVRASTQSSSDLIIGYRDFWNSQELLY